MKYIVLTIMAFAIMSCSQKEPAENVDPVVIQSQPIPRPNLVLPDVDRYQGRDVNWKVVTPENIDEMFQEMTSSGEATALFALTERGYENLALNLRDALKIIQQQKSVISGYRQYYINVDENIQEHNSQIEQ